MKAGQLDWKKAKAGAEVSGQLRKVGAEVSSGQLSQLHTANCQHQAKSDLILRQWLWEVLDRVRASLGLSLWMRDL